MSNLTVILPVNGRPEFTLRFLAYARRLPWPVDVVECEGGLRGYYRTMVSVLERVRTPFVMQADNDDFIGSGIGKAVRFLEGFTDYASARGRQVTFRLRRVGRPTGRIVDMYWGEPMVEGEYVNTRRFFAVYRTEVLRNCWRFLKTADPADLIGHERIFGDFMVPHKHHFDPSAVTYWSQAGGVHTVGARRNWCPPLADFLKAKSRIAVARIKDELIGLVPEAKADLAAIEAML